MSLPILSLILFAPIVGVAVILCLPQTAGRMIKMVAGGAMWICFALSAVMFMNYDWRAGGVQFSEMAAWLPDAGASYHLGVDGISAPLTLLMSVVGLSGIYSSWRIDKRIKEYFILFLLLVAGVAGAFVARDLLLFLLFYEVVVIPMYILIVVWGSTKRVTKEYAGMKLVVYLLIGSGFMLAGVFSLYVLANPAGQRTFDMAVLAAQGMNGAIAAEHQIVSFFLMMLGFATLASMWPFHYWSPDGHAGAPTAVSMVHAGLLKKLGAYGLLRVGLLMVPVGFKFWAPMMAAFATVSVIYAAFICLTQSDLKYMVGFSSVSHMGYIVIGIATADVIGLNGAVANMFAHGIMTALFFSMIGHVYNTAHTRDIKDLGGLAHQMPKAAVGFMIAGMASLGLPGLLSFIAEFTIFTGTFETYPVVAVVAISGIILTALYVLRALADALFGPRLAKWDSLPDLKLPEMVPLVLLSAFLIFFGFFPSLLMDVINSGIEPMTPLLAKIKTAATLWGGL